MDGNVAKLRALCAICGVRPGALAAVASVSPAYVSRLFNEPGFKGSPQFWRRIESRLGALVEARQATVFSVPVTPEEAALECLGASTVGGNQALIS